MAAAMFRANPQQFKRGGLNPFRRGEFDPAKMSQMIRALQQGGVGPSMDGQALINAMLNGR